VQGAGSSTHYHLARPEGGRVRDGGEGPVGAEHAALRARVHLVRAACTRCAARRARCLRAGRLATPVSWGAVEARRPVPPVASRPASRTLSLPLSRHFAALPRARCLLVPALPVNRRLHERCGCVEGSLKGREQCFARQGCGACRAPRAHDLRLVESGVRWCVWGVWVVGCSVLRVRCRVQGVGCRMHLSTWYTSRSAVCSVYASWKDEQGLGFRV